MTKIVSEAVQRDKGQLSKRAHRNKEMLPTSKPQTRNTGVSRPLHQNETGPPRRYDAVPLHGYTEKWYYTQTKQEDQQLYFVILTWWIHFDLSNFIPSLISTLT